MSCFDILHFLLPFYLKVQIINNIEIREDVSQSENKKVKTLFKNILLKLKTATPVSWISMKQPPQIGWLRNPSKWKVHVKLCLSTVSIYGKFLKEGVTKICF